MTRRNNEVTINPVSTGKPVLEEKYDTVTSRGMLSKGWYRIDGELFLAKCNSQKGLEPYSEVLASNLGKLLGLDVVEYKLRDASDFPEIKVYDIEHVSICKSYREDDLVWSLTFLRYIESIFPKVRDYWSMALRLDLDLVPMYKMLHFDAIIGNQDRHLNNWEIIRDSKGIRFSPIIDSGASLLAWNSSYDLKSYTSVGPDKSKPFAETHYKQMKLLKRVYTGNLIESKIELHDVIDEWKSQCSDVFQLLPVKRSEAIVTYVYQRLLEYGRCDGETIL